MTIKGRLARGKLNYESNKFLKNSETQEYINSLPKPKEAKKNGKSKSR